MYTKPAVFIVLESIYDNFWMTLLLYFNKESVPLKI